MQLSKILTPLSLLISTLLTAAHPTFPPPSASPTSTPTIPHPFSNHFPNTCSPNAVDYVPRWNPTICSVDLAPRLSAIPWITLNNNPSKPLSSDLDIRISFTCDAYIVNAPAAALDYPKDKLTYPGSCSVNIARSLDAIGWIKVDPEYIPLPFERTDVRVSYTCGAYSVRPPVKEAKKIEKAPKEGSVAEGETCNPSWIDWLFQATFWLMCISVWIMVWIIHVQRKDLKEQDKELKELRRAVQNEGLMEFDVEYGDSGAYKDELESPDGVLRCSG